MKKYYFRIHPLLYMVLSMLCGLGFYTAIFEEFYFAFALVAMFGIPLLLLLIIQIFKLGTLEIHQDKIVFGFFKRIIIRKTDFISIEVMGNMDVNEYYVIIKYNYQGTLKEAYLLKTYNVKLKLIYKELVEYFDGK